MTQFLDNTKALTANRVNEAINMALNSGINNNGLIDFIIYLFIAGLWIFGVFAAFDSKHIFGRINALLNNALISRGKDHKLKDRRWILRPLFMCNVCMSSFHGSILGFVFFGFSLKIILFVGCLAGLMYVSNLILPEYE